MGGWGGPEKDRVCSTALSMDLPSSVIFSGSALRDVSRVGFRSHWLWYSFHGQGSYCGVGGSSKLAFHESYDSSFHFFKSAPKVCLVTPSYPRSLGSVLLVLLAAGFQLWLALLSVSFPIVGFSWQILPIFLLPSFSWCTVCHLHCVLSYGTLHTGLH